MTTERHCAICGANIPNESPAGLCVACALGQATGNDTAASALPAPGVTLLLADANEGGSRIGRYKIVQAIGEGGCGMVYQAAQEEPVHRQVALKVIKPGMDSKQVLARFEAERQALALMDHPNIAKVLDAGATPSGRPYFVMELVKGVPITEYCDQAKLTTNDRLGLFLQVCQAVQHAHQKGIIHRDLKPSNILVALQDGVPVPKVIDFGIAKATTGQPLTDKTVFTAFEQFIGTPAYMSPEQAELTSLDIDTRSDIYSLGVLLYELLTGQTPFDAKELLSVGLDRMRKIIREEEPPRPSTRISTLSAEEQTSIAKRRQCEPLKLSGTIRGDLDWIVMRALEKERTRRYDTVNGLAADLRRYLTNEPIIARPPSAIYRLRKTASRNRLAVFSTLAVISALIFGTAISTWQAIKAKRAERQASAALEESRISQKAEFQHRERAEAEARRASQAATQAKSEADRARRAAAQADARYFTNERLLPTAFQRASEAYQLGKKWEDGLLIHEIVSAARLNWQLYARIPWQGAIGKAALTQISSNESPMLLISSGGNLYMLEAKSSRLIASAAVGNIHFILPDSKNKSVALISDREVLLFDLIGLKRIAHRPLEQFVTYASLSGTNLLILFAGGVVGAYDTKSISEQFSIKWQDVEAVKDFPAPKHACLSPDGRRLLVHGGNYLHPILFCDFRSSSPAFRTMQLPVTDFTFIDNTQFATWFLPAGEDSVEFYFYQTTDNISMIDSRIVEDDDTKEGIGRNFQGWTTSEGKSFVGLAGNTGVAVIQQGGARALQKDRYANLLPTEQSSLSYLSSDLSKGLLLLKSRNDAVLFQRGEDFFPNDTRNYCATTYRDGLLRLNPLSDFDSTYLSLEPFAPGAAPKIFSLQWENNMKWLPWSVGSSWNGEAVVVIAIDTDSDSSVRAKHNRVRAFVYKPRSASNSEASWRIFNSFDIEAPIGLNSSPRFVTVDPSGDVFIYWNSASSKATRYRVSGESLGQVEVSQITVRSPDGERVASQTKSGNLVVYEVASGNQLLNLNNQSSSAICFSGDGSRIIVARSGELVTYDIPSGNVQCSIKSDLLPIAYSAAGDNVVAFDPNPGDRSRRLVLTDRNFETKYVLRRAANDFATACFSESGRQLALMTGRSSAEIVRSLSPEEASDLFKSGIPEIHLPEAVPPAASNGSAIPLPVNTPVTNHVALNAEDTSSLERNLGDYVTLHGSIRRISLTSARNAANIEFSSTNAGASPIVWVSQDVYPKFIQKFGPDLKAALVDKRVFVSGRLLRYGGRRQDWLERFQITLGNPSDLRLVSTNSPGPQ